MSSEPLDDTEKIKALCETVELGLGDTVGIDVSLRVGGTTHKVTKEASAQLPLFDSRSDKQSLEIGDTIGEGGMGLVRQARQIALHRTVAVKTVRPDRESWEANQDLFLEALATGILEHPNIIPVYSLYQNERGAPLIVMKRVDGVSWLECITHPDRIPDLDGDLLTWHLEVFDELCRAAHFAHSRQIIHRDIKPDNVMIGAHGEVYLLDWGIAVTTDDEKARYLLHVDQAEGVAGTPAYMAPEMATAKTAELCPQTDVYLLGATLAHALSGEPPHNEPTLYATLLRANVSDPVGFGDDIPDELARIVHRAMSPKVEDRYETVEDLRRAVRQFREHRASITLSDEAAAVLVTMMRAIETDDRRSVQAAFEQCRFGCEHAIAVWSENTEAKDTLERARLAMAWFEVDARNLDAARDLLATLVSPPPDLEEAVATLAAELAEGEAEVESLRHLERETSVATGATHRFYGAVIAWLLLTVMPLATGGALNRDMELFFWHGFFEFVFLATVLFIVRRGLWANAANRKIAGVIMIFAVSLPLIRYVAWQTGMNVVATLAIESAAYTVGYAALGWLSRFNPWFGVAIYAIAAVLSVHLPDHLFVITSAANFLAIGYVALAYHRQRSVLSRPAQ